MKNRVEYLFLLSTARLLQLLPWRAVRLCAATTGLFVHHVLRLRRDLATQQMRRAFPSMQEREIHRAIRESTISIATTIFELLWSPRLTTRTMSQSMQFVNSEVLDSAMQDGRGVVLVSGHLGNWEWLVLGLSLLKNVHPASVYHPPRNPLVDRLLSQYRTRTGNQVVTMAEAPRRLLRHLAGGGVAFLVADQSAPRESIFIPFLGAPAATFQGPATFALKTDATLLGAYPIRRPDGRYDVHFEIISRENLPADPTAAIHELTRRQVRSLERVITQHPGQWLWQHRRWKNVPSTQDLVLVDPD